MQQAARQNPLAEVSPPGPGQQPQLPQKMPEIPSWVPQDKSLLPSVLLVSTLSPYGMHLSSVLLCHSHNELPVVARTAYHPSLHHFLTCSLPQRLPASL